MTLPLVDVLPRLRRMLSKPAGMRTALIIAAVCGLVEGLALASLLPALSTLASGEPVWGLRIGGWLVVFLVLTLMSFALSYINARGVYAVAMDFLASLHRLLGDQVAKQPLGWFAKPLAGRLSRLVSADLMTTGQIFAHTIGPMTQSLVSALVILIAAWVWNPLLGLVLTLAAPVFALILFASTALLRRGRALHEPQEVQLANRIVEFAQCQPALRSCGQSEHFAPLQQAMEDTRKAQSRAQWMETAGVMLSGAMTQVVIVILITVTGSLAVAGTLEPIPALAFIGLSLRFSSVLTQVTEAAMGLEGRRSVLDSIDEVLTAVPLPEAATPAQLPTPGTVEFDGVTFSYSPDRPSALQDVSLSVPAGTTVALVGPSGSGKTTVARLISRFYDAGEGTVKVSGTPVAEQTSEQLMGQLSMVFQDVYLFDDTLEANVAVGREDATQEEVRAAAETAGVGEIAARLPGGWQARVGEGGRALSGGERQRVAIARALLKRSPIVLLDEATSALDPENEANIVAAVEQLRRQATVVIIAHRLDTIATADQIVVFTPDGRIEARGTHEELLASGGTYPLFWDRLHRAQGWRLAGADA